MGSKLWGHFYLLIATFIISASFIFIEEIKNNANPLFIVFCRFLLASIILLIWILIFHRKELKNLKKLFLKTSFVGIFYAAFFVLQIYAQQYTTVLNVSSIQTLIPFLTALFMVLLFKNKLNLKQLIIYLFAMSTTLWIIFKGDINAILNLTLNSGDLIALFAAISLVLYIISMKIIYNGEKTIILVFTSLVNGTVFLVLFMLIFRFDFSLNQLDSKLFWHLAYLVVFSTLVTMFLYQKATILLGTISVSAYTYLTPSIVLILTWGLYGITPSLSVLIAVICSCFATLIIQTKFFQQDINPIKNSN